MNNDLIGRYIYAVTRHLPSKIRADVEKELDGLISDMLDERCGDNPPTDKDIKIVLMELGTPEELAVKYSGEEKKVLISGIYYIIYIRILKIVLPIVAAAVALGMIIAVLSDPPESTALYTLRLFGQTIGGAIAGVWQAFAFITVIFAVFEYTKADLHSNDLFSSLPPVPRQVQRIKPFEPIIGFCGSIVAAVLFLGFPQIMGFWRSGGEWLPIFNITVLRSLWIPIILWSVLGIVTESVKLIYGQHTKRVAIVTVVANLLAIGSAAIVFLNDNIINPDFIHFIDSIVIGGDNNLIGANQFSVTFIPRSPMIIFIIICFALVTETVTVLVKTWKYSRV